MNKRAVMALQIVWGFSIAGLLFSGYLSYNELFAGGCQNALVKCGSDFKMMDLPACVYGFFMYLAIFAVTLWGLMGSAKEEK